MGKIKAYSNLKRKEKQRRLEALLKKDVSHLIHKYRANSNESSKLPPPQNVLDLNLNNNQEILDSESDVTTSDTKISLLLFKFKSNTFWGRGILWILH